MNREPSTLVVGVGSSVGDDCAGPVAARRLAASKYPHRVVAIRYPAALLDLVEGVDRLHVVDACLGLKPEQPLLRCDWPAPELQTLRFAGTHDMDLTSVLSLAQRLELLPPETTVWCVAALDTGTSAIFAGPSAGVDSAIDCVVQAITDEAVAAAGHAPGAKLHA